MFADNRAAGMWCQMAYVFKVTAEYGEDVREVRVQIFFSRNDGFRSAYTSKMSVLFPAGRSIGKRHPLADIQIFNDLANHRPLRSAASRWRRDLQVLVVTITMFCAQDVMVWIIWPVLRQSLISRGHLVEHNDCGGVLICRWLYDCCG